MVRVWQYNRSHGFAVSRSSLHATGSVGQVGVTVSVEQKMLSTRVVLEVSTVMVQGIRGEAGPVQAG